MKYKAFISYNREADLKFAEALQNGLQQFAKPWNKLRAINVCRDIQNFDPSKSLPRAIEHALMDSEYLIVLASPGGADSPWVSKEIEFWKENKDKSRILLVQTGGRITWDPNAGDFAWDDTTAVPRVLERVFEEEPLITVLMDPEINGNLSLQNDAFKEKVAGLASAIRGIPKEVLFGKDLEEHGKAKRFRLITGWAVGILAGGVIIAGVLAYNNAVNKEDERLAGLGSETLRLAETPGRELDALVQGLLAMDRQVGTGPPPDRAIEGITAAVFAAQRSLPVKADEGGLSQAVFSPDGTQVLTAGLEGMVQIWDSQTGALVKTLATANDGEAMWSATYSPDGRTIVTGSGNGSIDLWDSGTGEKIRNLALLDTPIWTVEFSPDGERILAGGHDGHMRLWSTTSGELITDQASHASDLRIARFSDDGSMIATARWNPEYVWDGTIRLWNGQTGAPVKDLTGHEADVRDIAWFRKEGTWHLVTGSFDTTVRLWNVNTGEQIARHNQNDEVHAVAYSQQYSIPVSGDSQGNIISWTSGSQTTMGGHTDRVTDMAVAKNGEIVATGGADGMIRVLDLLPGYSFESKRLEGHADAVVLVAWSPDEQRLVSAADDGEARIWTLNAEKPKEMKEAEQWACNVLQYREIYTKVSDFCEKLKGGG